MYDQNAPATVIVKGPIFLFAVKLTTFNPNAMAPFIASPITVLLDIIILPITFSLLAIPITTPFQTVSSSPLHHAYPKHWTNANGDILINKSKGCSLVDNRKKAAVVFLSTVFEAVVCLMGVRGNAVLGGGDWRTLIRTVLKAAKTAPKRVRKRPHVVN